MSTTQASGKVKSPSGPSSSGWILALLIALLALAGTAYLWYLQDQQQGLRAQMQASVAAAVQRVDSQAGVERTLQRELDQQKTLLQQQASDSKQQIKTLQTQLSSQQQKLIALSTTDRNDWLLAEADYLIRLANQRLLMGKEISGASSLLVAADEIIRDLDDAGLYPVRKALAENIAALKAAGTLDVEGIYLQLAAVAEQAAALKLFEAPSLSVDKMTVSTTANAEAGNWWQRAKQSARDALQALRGYIQINNRDESYQALLGPEYEAAVRQNVQLMIEQAQLALLSGNQTVYQNSIEKARRWLRDYYTIDSNATESLLKTLADLQKVSVELELPDISSSQRALKSYMDTLHQLPSAKSPQQAARNPQQSGTGGKK